MNKKKILSSLMTFAFFTAIIVVGISWNNFYTTKAFADSNNIFPVKGYAWSDNIGWIKFNPSYGGVFYNNDTGEFSGYAWSDNIGWIKFNGLSAAPGEGNLEITGAKTVPGLKDDSISDSTVSDWARACAGTTSGDCSDMTSRIDGWDGWIKFDTGKNNPVTIGSLSETETNKRDFHGYAWGSDVVGWISFNCMEGGLNGSNICQKNRVNAQKSDYRVQIDFGPSSPGGSSSSNPIIDTKMRVTCSPSPISPLVGGKVTFTASVQNGKGSFNYIWRGDDSDSLTDGYNVEYTSYLSDTTFLKKGLKKISIRVRDSSNPKQVDSYDCPVNISPVSPSSSSKPKVQIIEI